MREMIKAFIGQAHDAPEHLVDNEFIKHGYRIGYDRSAYAIFKSMFTMHNEFVNVWSHCCGSLLFVGLIIYTMFYLSSMKTGSTIIKG